MNNIFTSSKTSEWTTPSWLYEKLNDEFHFTLDAACDNTNQKCEDGLIYYSPEDNALTVCWWAVLRCEKLWHRSIFCNPPYNNLEEWIKHGYEASLHGCTVVFILPTTKTDQKWWHQIVLPHASEIRFIQGRVKFGGCENAAPFPSCVVIFRPSGREIEIGSIKHD